MSIPISDLADLPPPHEWTNIAVRLACPRCAATGLIPVRQLDRALVCSACSTWSRVLPSELVEIPPPPQNIQVEVRTAMSEYQPDNVPMADVRPWSFRRFIANRVCRLSEFSLPLRAIGIAGAGVACLLALLLFRGNSLTVTTAAPLPSELQAREKILVEAWLHGDIGQMLRFVRPERDRELRQWLARHPAPSKGQEPLANRLVEIEVAAVDRPNPNHANVTARVTFLSDASAGQGLTLKHNWSADKSGAWYFLPTVPPLRAPRYRYR